MSRAAYKRADEFAVNTATEDAPLLAVSADAREAAAGAPADGEEIVDNAGDQHGTAFTAFFTMCTACAGAGILSLPLAVASIGVMPGIGVLIIFGIINSFTLRVLADLTDLHRDHLIKSQFSYEQLVLAVFGPQVGRVFSWIIVFTQLGSLTSYWVILLDLSVPVVVANDWLPGVSVDDLRAAAAYCLAFCVMFPLSFYHHIHGLWFVVFLAILSVVWTSGVVISEGVQAYDEGSAQGHLDHVGTTLGDWIATLPAVVFTFNCHQQLTPVYGWTKPEARTSVRLGILPGAILFCTVIYALTAVTGYLKFGDQTHGDILLNFDNSTTTTPWKADSSKLLMAFHVVLAYPVVLFPALRALDSELPPSCTSDGSFWGSAARNLVVVLITATLAIFLPDVQQVFGFVGGVLASMSVFIFPCAMMIYECHFRHVETKLAHPTGLWSYPFATTVMSLVLLVFGFFLVISSLYVSATGIQGSG